MGMKAKAFPAWLGIAAATLIAAPTAHAYPGDPTGTNCESNMLGALYCDGPVQPDGSWTRCVDVSSQPVYGGAQGQWDRNDVAVPPVLPLRPCSAAVKNWSTGSSPRGWAVNLSRRSPRTTPAARPGAQTATEPTPHLPFRGILDYLDLSPSSSAFSACTPSSRAAC